MQPRKTRGCPHIRRSRRSHRADFPSSLKEPAMLPFGPELLATRTESHFSSHLILLRPLVTAEANTTVLIAPLCFSRVSCEPEDLLSLLINLLYWDVHSVGYLSICIFKSRPIIGSFSDQPVLTSWVKWIKFSPSVFFPLRCIRIFMQLKVIETTTNCNFNKDYKKTIKIWKRTSGAVVCVRPGSSDLFILGRIVMGAGLALGTHSVQKEDNRIKKGKIDVHNSIT